MLSLNHYMNPIFNKTIIKNFIYSFINVTLSFHFYVNPFVNNCCRNFLIIV